jgi:hypothetical protein
MYKNVDKTIMVLVGSDPILQRPVFSMIPFIKVMRDLQHMR